MRSGNRYLTVRFTATFTPSWWKIPVVSISLAFFALVCRVDAYHAGPFRTNFPNTLRCGQKHRYRVSPNAQVVDATQTVFYVRCLQEDKSRKDGNWCPKPVPTYSNSPELQLFLHWLPRPVNQLQIPGLSCSGCSGTNSPRFLPYRVNGSGTTEWRGSPQHLHRHPADSTS
jgi:hypothetical protein